MSSSNNNNMTSINYKRPLEDLPLRPSTLTLFQKRGFTTAMEVQAASLPSGGGMGNLAQELDVEIQEAASLWREVQGCCSSTASASSGSNDRPTSSGSTSSGSTSNTHSASALLLQQKEEQQKKGRPSVSAIITFSRHVDELLQGGLALGELTEIAGLPGAGKTQWGMQLAVNARLPAPFGGCQGETVYIDTEGSFSPERAFQMSCSLVKHIDMGNRRQQQRDKNRGSNTAPLPDWFTPESILEGIHVYRVHDAAAQQAVLYALPAFLRARQAANAPVRLIVVDSMAFHYRAALVPTTTTATAKSNAANDNNNSSNYYMNRTRLLTAQAAFLAQIAVDFQVAVVTINQMTTQFSNGISKVVPALGESWAHAVTTRLLLTVSSNNNNAESQHDSQQQQQARTCQLVKSPRLPSGQAEYCVTADGVRGSTTPKTTTSAGGNHSKRPRTS
jgi:RAD51-like protein 2